MQEDRRGPLCDATLLLATEADGMASNPLPVDCRLQPWPVPTTTTTILQRDTPSRQGNTSPTPLNQRAPNQKNHSHSSKSKNWSPGFSPISDTPKEFKRARVGSLCSGSTRRVPPQLIAKFHSSTPARSETIECQKGASLFSRGQAPTSFSVPPVGRGYADPLLKKPARP